MLEVKGLRLRQKVQLEHLSQKMWQLYNGPYPEYSSVAFGHSLLASQLGILISLRKDYKSMFPP